MKDKFEKKNNCVYCEKEMDAKYRNKKFCSDKCRVYWNRENKTTPQRKVELPVTEPKITPNKIISPPQVDKKEMPSGLSRTDKMRWMRENS